MKTLKAERSVRLLRTKRLSKRVIVIGATLGLLTACEANDGAPSSPTSPSPVPSAVPPTPLPSPQPTPSPSPITAPRTVTITSNGVSPKEVIVSVGSAITFVNNDAIPHDIWGGVDHEHRACPEIDAVGFLAPGQSGQTRPFGTPRTCEYHDQSFHSALFNGRIVIQ